MAKELGDLIRECPELGEVLAEFENRVSYLENAIPPGKAPAEEEPLPDDKPWQKPQWQSVQSLRTMVNRLMNKLNEHLKAAGEKPVRTPPKKKSKDQRLKAIEL